MKNIILILLVFAIKLSFCQVTQDDLGEIKRKPTQAKWDVYKLVPFDISVKFPSEPVVSKTNAEKIEQITYTLNTQNTTDTNSMYFVTAIKFTNGFEMDSSRNITQMNDVIAQYKKICTLNVISTKQINYLYRKGILVMANVIWGDNKFIARMEFTYKGKYSLTQFVIGTEKSVNNWSSNLFFNSAIIE